MINIGIDPDSEANGVAVYDHGKLVRLSKLNTVQFTAQLEQTIFYHRKENIKVHIENVCGISAAFNARNKRANMAVKLKMAQHIGMCKQAQIEIERVCEALGVEFVRHPVSKMWKKDKAQFEKVTGWAGRSNEDTRSAAAMGWLGVQLSKGK